MSLQSCLFDIQMNGFAGVDYQQANLSAEDLRRSVDALHQHATGRIFLTLITDDLESLVKKFARIEQFRAADAKVAETVCGYHLEGPYMSPEPGYCGAHPPECMRAPDYDEFLRLQEAANGNIRLVTIAPEWDGSDRFIARAVKDGVEVSLGHTAADEAAISRAVDAGARFCTHLGNGIPAELHRHDNVLQRLLARDELYAFFIPDGIHIPPHVLKNFYRAKPEGKALFTTDCMAAAGAPEGRYTIGSVEVEVGADRVVRQPGKANFAGSALTPDVGVENLTRWLDLSPEHARSLFSDRIAELFGIQLPVAQKPLAESR